MQEDDPHRVLARNAACHQCRRRKLKCDAIKPTCGNCLKPRQRGPIKYEPPEPCTWDEYRDPSARALRKRETKRQRSEHEAAHLVKEEPAGPSPMTSDWSHGGPLLAARADVNEMYAQSSNHVDRQPPPRYVQIPDTAPLADGHLGPDAGQWNGSVPHIQPPAPVGQPTDYPAMDRPPTFDQAYGELVWSDWPRELPVLDVVQHILTVFFDRVPTIPKMFHRATFFANLALPPKRPEFPSAMLLHGILAATAPYLSPEALASRAYFPSGCSMNTVVHPTFGNVGDAGALPAGMGVTALSDGTPVGRFQTYHRRKSVDSLSSQVHLGNMIETAQTMALATYMDLMNGNLVDTWMEGSSAVRMVIPLHLNLSSLAPKDPMDRNPVMLPPARSALEQAQHDRTWWMIYLMEKFSTCGMQWPGCLPDSEITVELPVSQAIFEQGTDNLVGVQTLDAPEFYSQHLPQHVDSFVFLIKAMRLYTSTSTFSRHYGRGTHTYARYLADPRLRACLADINSFRMSYPMDMRRPTRMENGREMVDPDLVTAIGFTHSSVLNLGEPLVTHTTWSDDAAKMVLSAVRAILSLTYDLNATSYDITLLPTIACLMWTLSCRCLIRFITAARLSNDPVSSAIFESEFQVFIDTLARFSQRHPLAARHHARMLSLRAAANIEQRPGLIKLNLTQDDVLDPRFESKEKRAAGFAQSPKAAYVSEITPGSGGPSPSSSSSIGLHVPSSLDQLRNTSAAYVGSTPPTASPLPNVPVGHTQPIYAAPMVPPGPQPQAHAYPQAQQQQQHQQQQLQQQQPLPLAAAVPALYGTYTGVDSGLGLNMGPNATATAPAPAPAHNPNLPGFYHGALEGAEISSYSFDMDAMALLVENNALNGMSFDGTEFAGFTMG